MTAASMHALIEARNMVDYCFAMKFDNEIGLLGDRVDSSGADHTLSKVPSLELVALCFCLDVS